MCAAAAAISACADATAPTDHLEALPAVVFANEADPTSYVHANNVRLTTTIGEVVVVDQYEFHALRNPFGFKGHFKISEERTLNGASEAVVMVTGTIECFTIIGNRARVGGRVESTSFPAGFPVGSAITWSVTDNGQPQNAKDTASQPFGSADARAYCAAGGPYPESLVEKGKIQVRE
jgi:hypothetical protein